MIDSNKDPLTGGLPYTHQFSQQKAVRELNKRGGG